LSDWTFGLTLLVVGMGGTFASLWILSLLILILKKIFPYAKETESTHQK
jgi:Na+-transporting methylmalonyl-CoA/oxaloacetate decarboxylase gamma subunit